MSLPLNKPGVDLLVDLINRTNQTNFTYGTFEFGEPVSEEHDQYNTRLAIVGSTIDTLTVPFEMRYRRLDLATLFTGAHLDFTTSDVSTVTAQDILARIQQRYSVLIAPDDVTVTLTSTGTTEQPTVEALIVANSNALVYTGSMVARAVAAALPDPDPENLNMLTYPDRWSKVGQWGERSLEDHWTGEEYLYRSYAEGDQWTSVDPYFNHTLTGTIPAGGRIQGTITGLDPIYPGQALVIRDADGQVLERIELTEDGSVYVDHPATSGMRIHLEEEVAQYYLTFKIDPMGTPIEGDFLEMPAYFPPGLWDDYPEGGGVFLVADGDTPYPKVEIIPMEAGSRYSLGTGYAAFTSETAMGRPFSMGLSDWFYDFESHIDQMDRYHQKPLYLYDDTAPLTRVEYEVTIEVTTEGWYHELSPYADDAEWNTVDYSSVPGYGVTNLVPGQPWTLNTTIDLASDLRYFEFDATIGRREQSLGPVKVDNVKTRLVGYKDFPITRYLPTATATGWEFDDGTVVDLDPETQLWTVTVGTNISELYFLPVETLPAFEVYGGWQRNDWPVQLIFDGPLESLQLKVAGGSVYEDETNEGRNRWASQSYSWDPESEEVETDQGVSVFFPERAATGTVSFNLMISEVFPMASDPTTDKATVQIKKLNYHGTKEFMESNYLPSIPEGRVYAPRLRPISTEDTPLRVFYTNGNHWLVVYADGRVVAASEDREVIHTYTLPNGDTPLLQGDTIMMLDGQLTIITQQGYYEFESQLGNWDDDDRFVFSEAPYYFHPFPEGFVPITGNLFRKQGRTHMSAVGKIGETHHFVNHYGFSQQMESREITGIGGYNFDSILCLETSVVLYHSTQHNGGCRVIQDLHETNTPSVENGSLPVTPGDRIRLTIAQGNPYDFAPYAVLLTSGGLIARSSDPIDYFDITNSDLFLTDTVEIPDSPEIVDAIFVTRSSVYCQSPTEPGAIDRYRIDSGEKFTAQQVDLLYRPVDNPVSLDQGTVGGWMASDGSPTMGLFSSEGRVMFADFFENGHSSDG